MQKLTLKNTAKCIRHYALGSILLMNTLFK